MRSGWDVSREEAIRYEEGRPVIFARVNGTTRVSARGRVAHVQDDVIHGPAIVFIDFVGCAAAVVITGTVAIVRVSVSASTVRAAAGVKGAAIFGILIRVNRGGENVVPGVPEYRVSRAVFNGWSDEAASMHGRRYVIIFCQQGIVNEHIY